MDVRYVDALAELTAPGAPFEMTEAAIGGRVRRVYRNTANSLRDIFDRMVENDATAVVYRDERIGFADLRLRTLRLAAAMAASGVGKGDHVAIAMRNLPEYILAFWATQWLGAVLVSLNAWWVGDELAFAIADSKPKLLFVDGDRLDRLPADTRRSLARIVVTRPNDDGPGGGNVDLWGDFGRDCADAPPTVPLNPDDPSTMLYTSGTTGRPKGAVSSHRNHATNLTNTAFFGAVARRMAGIPLDAPPPIGQPAALQPFPMFHIGGLSQLYINHAFGSKLVLMHKWDADEAARLIDRERVTSIALAPSMLRQLIDSPVFAASDHSALTGFATGSAPVSSDLAADARQAFGPTVFPTIGYGLTETTSGVCANSGPAIDARQGSVGPAYPVTDVRIANPETGEAVEVGETGEIWVRGPTVVCQYWNRSDANRESFVGGGWFRTGDLGRTDEEGYIFIVDRLKDMIIRGGENIYCVEVEDALTAHSDVYEVAVVGEPDAAFGERVVAVVVPMPGSTPSAETLIGHARRRLAHFKVPSRIVFRSEVLERTATGKVDKKALRKALLSS